MKNFTQFYKDILQKATNQTILSIKNQKKQIKGMARFTSVNYAPAEYVKITFTDGTQLLIIPDDQLFYYSDQKLDHVKSIPDQAIGKEKVIVFHGKKFQLDNPNDYQFCLQPHVGQPGDIEGECRFSDYVPQDGSDEILSLGWLSHTSQRADVYCQAINQSQVSVLHL
jgi:hypothetical protein